MFGVEYIDQSFTAVDEARDFLRIPSLGVIPTITTRRDRRRRRAYRVLSVMLMAGIIAGFVAAYEYIPRVQYIVDSVVTAFGNMFGL
jgi:ferric-dicitrate binding protein FerR (iron transport regulator)